MVSVRPYKDTDKDFICSSFINSTYHNSIDASTKICNKLNWSVGMNKTINAIVQTFDISIACLDDDQDLILGYSIYKNDMLCYVYVKTSFRQQGISKLLLENYLKNTTQHQILFTSKYMSNITKQLSNWDFNPFI